MWRVLVILKAGCRTDNLKPLGWDAEALPQAPNKQGHLRTCASAIEVRFIEDKKKGLGWVVLQPLSRCIEDGPLQGAHQHVFQHRIVRDENIRRLRLHLMARKQFGVLWQCDGTTKLVRLGILPRRSWFAKP